MMGGGGRKNMKRRCQMRLSWGRNTIENSSNVLGIIRGGQTRCFRPQKPVENSVQPDMLLDVGALTWDHSYHLNTSKPCIKLYNRSSQEF
jgi:hypothetical protein